MRSSHVPRLWSTSRRDLTLLNTPVHLPQRWATCTNRRQPRLWPAHSPLVYGGYSIGSFWLELGISPLPITSSFPLSQSVFSQSGAGPGAAGLPWMHFCCFLNRVSLLYSPGCPGTPDVEPLAPNLQRFPTAFASRVLGVCYQARLTNDTFRFL